MSSSRPTRSASFRAHSTVSSIVRPEIGTRGQTSVAPIRGCSPECLRMSISSAAFRIARKAASTTASGGPAKVTTVRFVERPGSTSRSLAPSTVSTVPVMAAITAASRPSLKLGTHSTTALREMLMRGILTQRLGKHTWLRSSASGPWRPWSIESMPSMKSISADPSTGRRRIFFPKTAFAARSIRQDGRLAGRDTRIIRWTSRRCERTLCRTAGASRPASSEPS